MVLLPASANRPKRESTDLFCQTVRLFLIGSIAIVVPVFLAAPHILGLAFGKAYVGGATVLQMALIAAVLAGILRIGLSVLQGQGRPAIATVIGVLSLLASVGGASALLPLLGYVGATAGQCIGALCGLLLVYSSLRSHISLADLLPGKSDVYFLCHAIRRRLCGITAEVPSVG
jgi:O-antigen/teichoic acid export membrane protein